MSMQQQSQPTAPPDSTQELSDQQPLLGYQNPYLEKEADKLDKEDNASIMSEEAAQILDTKKTQEDVKKEEEEKAKAQAAPSSGNETSIYMMITVLTLFILFDCGKLIFEHVATKGTTIVLNVFNIYLNITNTLLSFTLTIINMGWKDGTEKMFDISLMKGYIAPAACFAVSQLFSLLQNGFLQSSSVRKVLNNLRILLTACFTKMVMGTGYTQLQWCLIVTIVLVTFQFLFLTSPEMNPFVGDKLVVGLIFNLFASLGAVFGSLLGEKHMKANKHLPFYLQNFQFSLFTTMFSIIGLVTTNGFAAILADTVSEWSAGENGNFGKNAGKIFRLEGKQGKTTQLISASKTAFFQYQNAFTAVPITVDYVDVSSGTSKGGKYRFSNKYSMNPWIKDDDRIGQELQKQISPIISTLKPEDNNQLKFQEDHFIYRDVYSVASTYAKLVLRMYNVNENQSLDSYSTRMKYLDPKEKTLQPANKGRRLDRHAGERYRDIGNNLLFDTQYISKQPFKFNKQETSVKDLYTSFALYIGSHEKIDQKNMDLPKDAGKNEFQTQNLLTFKFLDLFRRDSPHYRPINMAEKEEKKKDDKKDEPKKNEPKLTTYTGMDKDYFKLTQNVEEANRVDIIAKFTKSLNENSKKEVQGEYIKQLNDDKNKIVSIRSWSQEVEYIKAEKEEKFSTSMTLTYKRTTTYKMSLPVQSDDPYKATHLLLSEYKSFKIPFTCGDLTGKPEEASLDYSYAGAAFEGHFGQKKRCYLGDTLENIFNVKNNYFHQSSIPTLKANVAGEKELKTLTEFDSQKSEPVTDEADRLWIGTKDQVTKGGQETAPNSDMSFNHGQEQIDIENKLRVFVRKDGEFNNVDGSAFYTYPGKVPGNICTYASCYMRVKQQKNNGIAKLIVRAYHNPNTNVPSPFEIVKSYGSDEKKRAEFEHIESALANPFRYGVVHGYTRNPTPFFFLFTWTTLIAATCNIGQSWMSALTSKVLSSLWKTIASGVAFALLPMVEVLTMDQQKQNEIPQFPLILGVITVFLTVYLFQLAPKPPKKEEEKKGGDIESGKK